MHLNLVVLTRRVYCRVVIAKVGKNPELWMEMPNSCLIPHFYNLEQHQSESQNFLILLPKFGGSRYKTWSSSHVASTQLYARLTKSASRRVSPAERWAIYVYETSLWVRKRVTKEGEEEGANFFHLQTGSTGNSRGRRTFAISRWRAMIGKRPSGSYRVPVRDNH